MVSGINGWVLADARGEELITYKWGQAPTHHQGGHCRHTWRNNSGVEALVIRRDGWVSETGGRAVRQVTRAGRRGARTAEREPLVLR